MTKKQRIEELERKVDDLRREVDRLRDDVAVRPFVPCPYTPAEWWMPIYPEFPYQPPPYVPGRTDGPWPTLITGTTDNTADILWQ